MPESENPLLNGSEWLRGYDRVLCRRSHTILWYTWEVFRDNISQKRREKHVKKRKILTQGSHRVCADVCRHTGSECNAHYGGVPSG